MAKPVNKLAGEKATFFPWETKVFRKFTVNSPLAWDTAKSLSALLQNVTVDAKIVQNHNKELNPAIVLYKLKIYATTCDAIILGGFMVHKYTFLKKKKLKIICKA